MTDSVLEAETTHFYVSPFIFVIYAEDFYKASVAYNPQRPFSPVKYFLLCHSIELSLKAYLLLKGVTREEIQQKSLGHNLSNILAKCEKLAVRGIVQFSESQKLIISELNKWYSRKGFEYFELENLTSGTSKLPDIALIQELAKLLIDSIKEPCQKEANKP